MKDNWLALESNPEVINEYVNKIGFETSEFYFTDLFSVEQWAQDMILKPVLGVLFIFPYTKNYKAFKKDLVEKLDKEG